MITGAEIEYATTMDDLVRRAQAKHPDKVALIDAPNRPSIFSGEPVRLTWAELSQSIDSVAHALQTAGVVPGHAVAIQLPNVVELPITILACQRIGAVATPFPIQHRQHELRYGLDVSKAKTLVTGARPDRDDLLSLALDIVREFDASLLTFGPETIAGATLIDLSADASVESAVRAHNADADDVATICWTSGTTGVPKGVPRTHAMWRATSAFQVDELGLVEHDKILCPFPLVNMGGIGGMLLPWIDTGSTLVLHHPIDLPVFLSQLSAEQITYTVAPPPLLNMLLQNDALLTGVDLSNIRAITSGSAPLDPWMVEGWQERGIEIVNAFGSNEGASMLSTQTTVADPAERARFFPLPPATTGEVRLVDLETGHEIEDDGVAGELRFRGPLVFDGYVDSDGAEFDDDGFYRTGDVFERATSTSGSPLLRFIDRAKDIIIRGGINISAAEVEALISSHADVAECAVVGYPDSELGERVCVFIVPAEKQSPSLGSIIDHLRGQDIASYKLPERIELIDVLPRNPVGKVLKADLRDLVAPPVANRDDGR